MTNADTRGSLSAQSIVAEFAALRSEIEDRSGHQRALVALNLTVLGTVTGYVLVSKANLILLVVPFFSTLLGLLWLDHAVVIGKLGAYLGEELRDELVTITGNPRIMGWEQKAWKFEEHGFQRFVLFGIPVFGAFGGGSLAALIVAWSALRSGGHYALWMVDALLLLMYAISAGVFLLRPNVFIPRRHRGRKANVRL